MADEVVADKNLAKLQAKVAKSKWAQGLELRAAIPVKQGNVAAGTAALMAGGVLSAVLVEKVSKGNKVQGATASAVRKKIGNGSDFVLCITNQNLLIARLVAFGILGGSPTVVSNDQVKTVHCNEELKKQVIVQFIDDSTLAFKFDKKAHRDVLASAVAQTWPDGAADG